MHVTAPTHPDWKTYEYAACSVLEQIFVVFVVLVQDHPSPDSHRKFDNLGCMGARWGPLSMLRWALF